MLPSTDDGFKPAAPGQNVVLRSKAQQKGIKNYNYHQAMGAGRVKLQSL